MDIVSHDVLFERGPAIKCCHKFEWLIHLVLGQIKNFKVEQMQRNMILENLIVITKIQNNKKLMGKNNKTKNKTTWSNVQKRFQQNTMQFQKNIWKNPRHRAFTTTPPSLAFKIFNLWRLFISSYLFFVVLLMLVSTVFVDPFFNMVFVWNS